MSADFSEKLPGTVSPTEAYENLANAIVESAFNDYKAALHALERNPHNIKAVRMIHEVEQFFHSGWYTMLTSLDPDALIAVAKRLVKEETAERIRRETKRVVTALQKTGGLIDAATLYYLTTMDISEEQAGTGQKRIASVRTSSSVSRLSLKGICPSKTLPSGWMTMLSAEETAGTNTWCGWKAESREQETFELVQSAVAEDVFHGLSGFYRLCGKPESAAEEAY